MKKIIFGTAIVLASAIIYASGVSGGGSGGGGSAAWGGITGTLSNQTDLNTSLSGKLGTSDNAATATALASNPAACSANQYVTDIAANGTLTCAAASASYPLTANDTPSVTAPSYSFANGGSGHDLNNSRNGMYLDNDGNGNGVAISSDGVRVARFSEFMTGYAASPGLLLGNGANAVSLAMDCLNGAACSIYFNPGAVTWELGPSASGGSNAFTLYNGSVGTVFEFNSNTSKMNLKTGQSSSTTGGVGSRLKVDSTAVGNVGTGPDVLQTYTVPASVLTNTNDSLEWRAFGTSTSGTYTVACKFGGTPSAGGTTLVSTGSVAFASGNWEASGTIIRTGAATQIATSQIKVNGVVDINTYSTPTETLSGTVALYCYADGVASNDDVISKGLTVNWFPAN